MDQQLRGVRVIRLSVLTDETTSPERQRAAVDSAAAALNIECADRNAIDLGISASRTTPFERPGLGDWLKRPDDFDALLCWRFDRLVRSMDDIHALSTWARDHRKMIVFAEGPGGRLVLDFRNPLDPMAQLMVTVFAFAAQMEAQAIKERVQGAQAAMRVMPLRWRGSRPPYGYQPAPLESGGWTLEPDPEAVKVITRVIKSLTEGTTLAAIAVELNQDSVPSPRDHWALKNERKTGGKTGGQKGITRDRFGWTFDVLKRLIKSETLIGWKVSGGVPVRDSIGDPVMCTDDPILSRAEFDAVQLLLPNQEGPRSQRRDTKALLLGVVHCTCGARMYLSEQTRNGRVSGLYKCAAKARGRHCDAPSHVRADWIEDYVTEQFLLSVGGLTVTVTQVIPGYDPQPEIDATAAEYTAHMEQQGRQQSRAARDAWQRRADALDKRLAELESRERIEPRTETTRTGRLYADEWRATEDTTARRAMLLEAGTHVVVSKATTFRDKELDTSRVTFELAEPFFADAAADFMAMADELEYGA
ncbi:recombinase family protein [Streptomyces sp. NBC_01318]|uniref:recombinase family protein n=1 Tax=Streptomyces sp. NBC_01318 TaxID=2903823 RepID=UPI002E15FB65|nr:recombinase family protein [Streptomyces sp. NBC_01318]